MQNIIYGGGVYGEIFCREIESSGVKIDYFIDQYTKKTSICNKSIKRLKDVSLENTNIFISITSPKAEVEVIQTLKDCQVDKILSFSDCLHKFPNLINKCVAFSKTWYSSVKEEMLDYPKLDKLPGLLKDDKSIDLLQKVIKFRETLSPENYPVPDLDPQYFPQDIDLFSHIDMIRFVDGGAYTGDTIAESLVEFKNAGRNIDYIASFEPDTKNIKTLQNEINIQKDQNENVNFLIYPCGLWSSNTILQFSDNSDAASSIVNKDNDNITTIMTTSLDNTLIGANPNYIKMDIEGAEKEAIFGAKDIIAKNSPVLAICCYHKPQDIWELPLIINELNPNYNMYFRIYGHLGIELVLYCIPKGEN